MCPCPSLLSLYRGWGQKKKHILVFICWFCTWQTHSHNSSNKIQIDAPKTSGISLVLLPLSIRNLEKLRLKTEDHSPSTAVSLKLPKTLDPKLISFKMRSVPVLASMNPATVCSGADLWSMTAETELTLTQTSVVRGFNMAVQNRTAVSPWIHLCVHGKAACVVAHLQRLAQIEDASFHFLFTGRDQQKRPNPCMNVFLNTATHKYCVQPLRGGVALATSSMNSQILHC